MESGGGAVRGDAVGLCARCVHARQVPTPERVYWMCQRSLTDPRYPKYPRLPVLSCAGFESRDPAGDRATR